MAGVFTTHSLLGFQNTPIHERGRRHGVMEARMEVVRTTVTTTKQLCSWGLLVKLLFSILQKGSSTVSNKWDSSLSHGT